MHTSRITRADIYTVDQAQSPSAVHEAWYWPKHIGWLYITSKPAIFMKIQFIGCLCTMLMIQAVCHVTCLSISDQKLDDRKPWKMTLRFTLAIYMHTESNILHVQKFIAAHPQYTDRQYPNHKIAHTRHSWDTCCRAVFLANNREHHIPLDASISYQNTYSDWSWLRWSVFTLLKTNTYNCEKAITQWKS